MIELFVMAYYETDMLYQIIVLSKMICFLEQNFLTKELSTYEKE